MSACKNCGLKRYRLRYVIYEEFDAPNRKAAMKLMSKKIIDAGFMDWNWEWDAEVKHSD